MNSKFPRYFSLIWMAIGVVSAMTPGWLSEDGTWSNRKKITIDHRRVAAGARLTDFPVLISTVDPDLKAVVKWRDGSDIAFTAADGVTTLAREIESYNPSTGALSAWVKVPELSATEDTVLYLYFGNGKPVNGAARATVWSYGFRGVYHLDNVEGAIDGRDATSAGRNLIGSTPGFLGAALSRNDYALTSDDGATASPTTLALWLRRSADYVGATSRGTVTSSPSGAGDLEFRGEPGPNTLVVKVDGEYHVIAANLDKAWHHVALARTGARLKAYVDGRLVQEFALSAEAVLGFRGIGQSGSTGTVTGAVRQVEWSSIERPASWILTAFANQAAPEMFAGVGDVEPTRPEASAFLQLFQQPDGVDPALASREDVSKRTANSRHFRNSDGTWTALVAPGLNRPDGKGGYVPALAEVWQDGEGGWEMRGSANPVKLRRTAKGHELRYERVGDTKVTRSVAIQVPAVSHQQDNHFQFGLGGLVWDLAMTTERASFTTLVKTSRGSRSYTLSVDAGSGKARVQSDGTLALGTDVGITRAWMIRADGKRKACSGWQLSGSDASFICDDSEFPKSAFPYTIDPDVTQANARHGSCVGVTGYDGIWMWAWSWPTLYRPTSYTECNPWYGGGISDSTGMDGDGHLSVANAETTLVFDPSGVNSTPVPVGAAISSARIKIYYKPSIWGGPATVPNGCYLKAYSIGIDPPYWMGPNFSTPDVINWAPFNPGPNGQEFSIPSNKVAPGASTRYHFQLRCTSSEGTYLTGPDQGFAFTAFEGAQLLFDWAMPVVDTTVTTSPAGLSMVVDGTTYTSPRTFSWILGTTHTVTVPTPQAGPAGTQYLMGIWSGSLSTANPYTITVPSSATTYTAEITTQYYITLNATPGGTITPSSGWVNSGQATEIRATPYLGYAFLGFDGDLWMSSMVNPNAVVATAPKTVTAKFSAPGSYVYYYIDRLGSSSSNWTSNGSLSYGTNGITTSGSSGGSLISTVAMPGGTSYGEVQAYLTLAASGGTYTTYMMASSGSILGPTTSGTFYAAELQNPTINGAACAATLALYRVVSGSVTSLGTVSSVPCRSGMIMRLVKTSSTVFVYLDAQLYLKVSDSTITSGMPGVGVRGAPAGNSIAQAQLGPLDTTAPTAVAANAVSTLTAPNQVDFHWKGTSDNSGGSGVAYYCVSRSGGPTLCSQQVADLTDATVSPGTTYSYQIQVFDYHGNVAPTTVSVTTPPAGTIDPRRVGVRSTGAYWGGSGENIDVRSGNLAFVTPLLKAQSRGWGLGFNLVYNSQNWRQDGSTVWNLGEDVGYGYGWRLLAGSLTPVWGNNAVHHYTFMDSTGAEYRLGVNTGGVWTSSDSVYVNYDSNTNRLYFNDGTFWVMGCSSGGTETDAGTMYPTLIQDTNGNQILIRYNPGVGLAWGNSSSRISQIEDVRANDGVTYRFAYNTDAIPHLTSISNNIMTGEGYSFSYATGQPLSSPFGDGSTFGTANRLSGMTISGVNVSYGFQADTAGQMTQVTFPYGAYLKWGYTAWNYSGSRKQMEVTSRILSKDGTSGAEKTYPFTHSGESNNGSLAIHGRTDLDDPGGKGGRTWYFSQSGGTMGLLSQLERYNNPGRTVVASDAISWSQDPAGRYYLGNTTSSADGTVVKGQSQTLDTYGNVTRTQVYDGSTLTLVRTYDTSYMSPYSGTYIRNRVYQQKVSVDGSSPLTLATFSYDPSWLTDRTGLREHDSAYGTSYLQRGNVATKSDMTGSTVMTYDIAGNVTSTQGPTGSNTTLSYSGSNYAVPTTITTGSLSENLQFNSFLGLTQDTGPNGDTSTTAYDSYARPSQSTSKSGAVTYYVYATSPLWTVAAVTNGKYSRKTLDGLGRTVKVEMGTTTGSNPNFTFGTPASVVETTYDPCGCSPMGKTSAVSMPHANGASPVWTTYTYDGLGRTIRQTLPDGSHKDYAYSVNTATLTDEAGKWKKYTVDGLGNLKQVEEPSPAGGSWFTYYTYDVLNHLAGVNMPRPSGTQTRSFSYGNPPGLYLQSATNPETGTVTYSYTSGLLTAKVDAKNQRTEYSYDGYNRVTQVRHYPMNGGGEDTCQQVNFTYDFSSIAGFSYLAGRLATRSYSVCINARQTDFVDMYGYTQAGQVAIKRLRVKRGSAQSDLDGIWMYDNEGKMTGVVYPSDSGGTSGGTYTVGYNALGQPTTMTDGSAWPLVSGATYGPAGELLTLGGGQGGYSETRTYNSRLQLTSLNGVTFTYPGSNNGKMSSQTEASSGETISYQYDTLNRLISATSSQGWSQGFTYDGFGNLTGKTALQGSVPVFSAAFDPATNRQVGINYDANGNQLTDAAGYSSLQYDIENRLVWAQKGNQAPGYGYGYDPDNRRVFTANHDYSGTQWTSGAEYVVYYGVGGQRLMTFGMSVNGSTMTMATVGSEVYFGSRIVRRKDINGAIYTAPADRLGSFGKFYPYGEEKTNGIPSTTPISFATYSRDAGTGLDYAVNRYYNSTSGRFMTADPYQASGGPADPGSWNRYSYTRGDPANRFDPEGLYDSVTVRDRLDDIAYIYSGVFSSGDGASLYRPRPLLALDPPGAAVKAGRDPANKGGYGTKPSGTKATAAQYLGSNWHNCMSLFGQDSQFDADAFLSTLNGMQLIDTRGLSPTVTVDYYAHNGDTRLVKDVVSTATTIQGTNIVLLGPDYFTNETQTQQIAIAVHEALHIYLDKAGISANGQETDDFLMSWLSQFGAAFGDYSNSGSITDWIVGTSNQMDTNGGCKKP